MKSMEIPRRVDKVGRVCLPVEWRNLYQIQENTLIEFSMEGNALIVKKCQTACGLCGSRQNIVSCMNVNFCPECLAKLAACYEAHKK